MEGKLIILEQSPLLHSCKEKNCGFGNWGNVTVLKFEDISVLDSRVSFNFNHPRRDYKDTFEEDLSSEKE